MERKVAKIKLFKMSVLMLCMLLVPAFAGCTLVTTNVDKQLNEVVANYDNGRVTVTREQLIMTYNSIGNSRYDNSSTVTEEGVEKTLDLALDRSILVDFLTADDKQAEREALGIDKIVLTTYEANEVWRNVYSYINSSVKSYETELREADNAVISSDEEESSDSTAYSAYEKKYTYYQDDDGKYILEYINADETVENKSIAIYDINSDKTFAEKAKDAYNNFRTTYWEYTDSKVMDPTFETKTSYSDKAWNKYINALIRAEADRNLSKEPAEVFLRRVQEIYQVYYQNQVLTRLQNDFNDQNLVTINMVATKFKELYSAQKEQFDANPSAFDSLVSTSAEKIYYMYDTTGYFKVNHILVKFSDDQTKRIEAEKTKLSNLQITKSQYEANVQAIKSETKAYNRDTKEYESLDSFMAKLKNALNAVSGEEARMAVFREFMHRYSQDDNTLNAESCYYIPTDSSKDTMQEDFANVSRELYNDGKGQVSAIKGFAETSYGYHVIMYTGEAERVSDAGSNETILSNLDAYRLNPLYNKTMLDKVIESVTLTSYSQYESNILNQVKAGKTITKKPSAYKDLYSK